MESGRTCLMRSSFFIACRRPPNLRVFMENSGCLQDFSARSPLSSALDLDCHSKPRTTMPRIIWQGDRASNAKARGLFRGGSQDHEKPDNEDCLSAYSY